MPCTASTTAIMRRVQHHLNRIIVINACALFCVVSMCGLLTAANAAPIAEPAPRAEVAACAHEVAAARPTQDVRQRVHDVIGLGGCIADGGSGIAHAFLEWSSDDAQRTGRICTDPSIIDGLWECRWDTTIMPEGNYTVTFVAIDDAGNRGTFDRPYQVVHEPTDRADTPAASSPIDGESSVVDPAADPRVDERNAVINLAMMRIDACMRNEVTDAPTSDPRAVSQVQQANMVAACVQPALEALGAVSVLVDALPVPPVVIIQVTTQQEIARLIPVVPSTIAGVPIALELRCARDETHPCQQT